MEDGLGGKNEGFAIMINGKSLNPCFNGRWSRSNPWREWRGMSHVLILVLMEDGLGDEGNCVDWDSDHYVLILVLMEDGLGEVWRWGKKEFIKSLNPCFNGRWSRRAKKINK